MKIIYLFLLGKKRVFFKSILVEIVDIYTRNLDKLKYLEEINDFSNPDAIDLFLQSKNLAKK